MSVPEQLRDKTYSELREEYPEQLHDPEEVQGEYADVRRLGTLYSAAIVFGEMFEADVITLGEYLDMTDYIMEEERELDVSVV